jgi:ferredoxin/flavodoxin---NADP+ reductase
VRDITVIGAGPVGLSAAFWAGMREASVQIVDALPEIGGQLTALYPEKPIYDVPGHPVLLARELVELHRRQIEPFDVPLHLSTTVEGITLRDDHAVLHTSSGDLPTRTVIVAAGHGEMRPRSLPELDRPGVAVVMPPPASLADKTVVVVGGGDSAVDASLLAADHASHVHLVHRRERFRALESSVSKLLASPRISVHTPRRVVEVAGNGAIEGVMLDDGSSLPCDEVLLQLGFRSSLGPLAGWGFDVSRDMRTSVDRVWACGDVTAYDGKLKLIAVGYAEAATAVAQAVRFLRPETPLQPGYSTDTGIPGR